MSRSVRGGLGLLAVIAIAGCAHDQTLLTGPHGQAAHQPVGLDPVPDLHSTINPTDPTGQYVQTAPRSTRPGLVPPSNADEVVRRALARDDHRSTDSPSSTNLAPVAEGTEVIPPPQISGRNANPEPSSGPLEIGSEFQTTTTSTLSPATEPIIEPTVPEIGVDSESTTTTPDPWADDPMADLMNDLPDLSTPSTTRSSPAPNDPTDTPASTIPSTTNSGPTPLDRDLPPIDFNMGPPTEPIDEIPPRSIEPVTDEAILPSSLPDLPPLPEFPMTPARTGPETPPETSETGNASEPEPEIVLPEFDFQTQADPDTGSAPTSFKTSRPIARSVAIPEPSRPGSRADHHHRVTASTTTTTTTNMSLRSPGASTLVVDETVAWVGHATISRRQLDREIAFRIAHRPLPENLPLTQRAQLINRLAGQVLHDLVDRHLILRAVEERFGKRHLLQPVLAQINQDWEEQQIPKLIEEHKVTDRYELEATLGDGPRSLKALHQRYVDDTLIAFFLQVRIRPETQPQLPELLAHYAEHRSTFAEPDKVVWNELVCKFGPGSDTTEAEAYQLAQSWIAQLAQGAKFAELARDSDGLHTDHGWRRETSLGGFKVEAINQALQKLPIGQVSPVIEGPTSLHVIRILSRTPARIAPFHEVQDQVKQAVAQQKRTKALKRVLQELRDQTTIRTIFDGTESDPNINR